MKNKKLHESDIKHKREMDEGGDEGATLTSHKLIHNHLNIDT